MANIEFCPVTSALASSYLNAITSLSRKFASLQRLAQLLEQIGSSFSLPNLSSLISVTSIDAGIYASLVQACPFLGLPTSATTANISQLQSTVASAYNQLIQTLKAHPFNRLNLLQGQMDKSVSQAGSIVTTGPAFLQCLIQSCGNAPSNGPISSFDNGFVASGGKVLSPTMQASAAKITNMIATVTGLLSGPPVTVPLPPQLFQVPIPTDHPIPPPPIAPVI